MNITNLTDIGELIRLRRQELGRSQSALADEIGATRQWISRLEKGHNDISAARLLAVVSALELNIDVRPARQDGAVPTPSPSTTTRLSPETLAALRNSAERIRNRMAHSVDGAGIRTEIAAFSATARHLVEAQQSATEHDPPSSSARASREPRST